MTRNRPNILLITADQWRGDCLGAAGHPSIQTPALDELAAHGTFFENHYAATAPCSPARASLYTGLYQMNHRVIWNGAPLDDRFDNIARAARRAGYLPSLFGYTDTSPDPRTLAPADPDLQSYEGTLPGFEVRQSLPEDDKPWLSWLASRGYDRRSLDTIHHVEPEAGERISLAPTLYGANETQTAFLTDAFLNWHDEQEPQEPWFAHVSFLRPHPPICVAEPYNTMYDPEDDASFAGSASVELEAAVHPLAAALQASQKLSHIPGAKGLARDLSQRDLRRLRALYFGMISEVDAQIGRILEQLKTSGDFENTLIIFTSDHAEMMGDHCMLGKGGFYRESYHIPLIIKPPAAQEAVRVPSFTSAVDIFPTLLDLLNVEPKHAPDGGSLMPFIEGKAPDQWRSAAIWEYDYRWLATVPEGLSSNTDGRDRSLISRYDGTWQYVHFEALPALLLKPNETHSTANFADQAGTRSVQMEAMSDLLSLRMRHNEETLARRLVWDFYPAEG
ncbi:sulfatase-like hydrolase/transferase [uncultured Roseibium sp.]|uniref:sulfatase-like hydrolase/transferase n=1 Tax=uncultured Roseibium sp. TaxID=1936171 RepID=UPI002598CF18|nr:sulfatase-like hydrolase/transferase [uncultured Roseibium sp.]